MKINTLHNYALSIATNLDISAFDSNTNTPQFTEKEIPVNVSKDMSAFIINALSTAEIKHMLSIIEEAKRKINNEADTHLFTQSVRPLLEMIGNRDGIEHIKERESFSNVHIEIHKDTHKRQVIVIEIGRTSDMKEKIAEMLQAQTDGQKQNPNITISREGLIDTQSEEAFIVSEAIKAIENAYLEQSDVEFEIYLQAPSTIGANIAIGIGKSGIDAHFGRWKDGEYILT